MHTTGEPMMDDLDVDQVHNQAVDLCIERMKFKLVQLSRRIGYADAAWIEQSLQDAFNHLKR
jgi:hypothetical protein